MAKTCKNHQETVNVHNFNCETKWPFSRFPSMHGLFAVVLYFLLMFVLCLKLFLCSLHPKASGSMVRHYGFSPLVSTIFYISPPHLLNCLTAYTAYAWCQVDSSNQDSSQRWTVEGIFHGQVILSARRNISTRNTSHTGKRLHDKFVMQRHSKRMWDLKA